MFHNTYHSEKEEKHSKAINYTGPNIRDKSHLSVTVIVMVVGTNNGFVYKGGRGDGGTVPDSDGTGH